MNVYDTIAPNFDQHRALPDDVLATIRGTILRSGLPVHPRILDLGAGSGRIGHSFVLAGDDYIGADLSFGMLRTFAGRTPCACLVQADAACLPFPNDTFDAVLLIQVLSGASGWRHFLAETMRVLRPAGRLIVGRVVAPNDGIDAKMKTQLAAILDQMDIHPYRDKPREAALSWLAEQMPAHEVITAATWVAERRPDAFLERHGGGARFSVLDESVKQEAMHRLADWATRQFGSLQTTFAERYGFELIEHRFQQRTTT
jgi:ubiquinone/menaquinone biosynthesis C-methylase UbiE